MYIGKDHLNYIRHYVNSILEKSDIEQLKKDYENLSKCRFRMDLFYATKITIGDGVGMTGDINIPALTDSHIDTAMKKIIQENNLSHIGK